MKIICYISSTYAIDALILPESVKKSIDLAQGANFRHKNDKNSDIILFKYNIAVKFTFTFSTLHYNRKNYLLHKNRIYLDTFLQYHV